MSEVARVEQPAWPILLTPVGDTSFSRPYKLLFAPVERPAFTEIITKIDALAARHLVPFLHTHGASVEMIGERQTYLARLPSGKRRTRTFRVYHVTFPEGMRRLDGPATRWLVPFTLLFPDGTSLQGQVNAIPDPEEILLGWPGTSQGPQDECIPAPVPLP